MNKLAKASVVVGVALVFTYIGYTISWNIDHNSGKVITSQPTTAPATTQAATTPDPEPPTPPPAKPAPDCNPNYTPCIPNSSYDLDCGDIRTRVQVIGSDPYRLDGDGDGIGCESY